MKNQTSLKTTIGMVAVALLASISQVKADTLEAALKENGWDKIVGTWTDTDDSTTTFSWKYPGTVLESVTKMGEVERYSMLWRNLKTGTVSIISADSKGGSSKGDCEFSSGKAVFKIEFVTADGKSGNYTVNYTLDGDNLSVNIDGQDKVIKLVRK
jgi:hypothetical protein